MQSAPRLPNLCVPLLARTTSSDSGGGYLPGSPGRPDNVIKLVITAISGAGATLNVSIEHSNSGSGWSSLVSFPAQTATTTGIVLDVPYNDKKPYVRVSWTITGTTPSVTFSVQTALTHPLLLAG